MNSAQQRKLETAGQLKWLLRPLYKGAKHYFIGPAGWGVSAFREAKYNSRTAPFLVHLAQASSQQAWMVGRNCAPGATLASQETPLCKGPEFADQRLIFAQQKFDETWRYYGPLEYGEMNAAYAAVVSARDRIAKGEIGARQAAQQIDEELQQQLAKFYETMRSYGVQL